MRALDELLRELRAIGQELVARPTLARPICAVAATLEGEPRQTAGDPENWGWSGILPWQRMGLRRSRHEAVGAIPIRSKGDEYS